MRSCSVWTWLSSCQLNRSLQPIKATPCLPCWSMVQPKSCASQTPCCLQAHELRSSASRAHLPTQMHTRSSRNTNIIARRVSGKARESTKHVPPPLTCWCNMASKNLLHSHNQVQACSYLLDFTLLSHTFSISPWVLVMLVCLVVLHYTHLALNLPFFGHLCSAQLSVWAFKNVMLSWLVKEEEDC